MARYRAIYKCGICGELIPVGGVLNIPEYEAEKQVTGVLWRNANFSGRQDLNPVPLHITHNCVDGSCGVAQFIGLKKEQLWKED